MTRKIAIFISGRGSNMAALINAVQDPSLAGTVALVVSNRSDAYGLERAAKLGIKTVAVSHKHRSREAFEVIVEEHLVDAKIDLICLAGFMRVLSPAFVKRWEGRIMNIHPSLLPLFRGLRVHEQALQAGVAVSGCTVHWVTAELDGGPIIGQAVVPVRKNDTAETLGQRIQIVEHDLYTACLRKVLEDKRSNQPTCDFLISIR